MFKGVLFATVLTVVAGSVYAKTLEECGLSPLQFPGASETTVIQVNANCQAGGTAGFLDEFGDGHSNAFLYTAGKYELVVPDPDSFAPDTFFTDMNDSGVITGGLRFLADFNYYAYAYRNGEIRYIMADRYETHTSDISNSGLILGDYSDGVSGHTFVTDPFADIFEIIMYPGAAVTFVDSMTEAGELFGTYDGDHTFRWFQGVYFNTDITARVPAPAPFFLLALGLPALVLLRYMPRRAH